MDIDKHFYLLEVTKFWTPSASGKLFRKGRDFDRKFDYRHNVTTERPNLHSNTPGAEEQTHPTSRARAKVQWRMFEIGSWSQGSKFWNMRSLRSNSLDL